ncbi:MAG: hypothetical protein QOI98_1739, partial [Solirubrobacteraceae bacterium]|nr:hypothetical protein [Solirubrobacteraceae bacterium]
PVAGSARRAHIRLRTSAFGRSHRRVTVVAEAVIRDGAGERVTDTKRIVAVLPRRHRHHARKR